MTKFDSFVMLSKIYQSYLTKPHAKQTNNVNEISKYEKPLLYFITFRNSSNCYDTMVYTTNPIFRATRLVYLAKCQRAE